MQTLVIIGNSQTYVENGRMITPRGYKLWFGSLLVLDGRTLAVDIQNEPVKRVLVTVVKVNMEQN